MGNTMVYAGQQKGRRRIVRIPPILFFFWTLLIASFIHGQARAAAPMLGGGNSFSVGLKHDGTVRTWGSNVYGQIGNGSTTPAAQLTPYTIASLTGVTSIAAGGYHGMAIINGGTVKLWGYNSQGQIGNNSTTNQLSPITISGLTGVTAVAAGDSHSLALLSNGTIKAWGNNTYGQLGRGNTTTPQLTPVLLSTISNVAAISACRYHSLALITGGTVKAWGDNQYGQLGDGTITQRTSPTTIPGLSGVTQLSAGYQHSLALMSNGTVKAWGRNTDGALGDGTIVEHRSPTDVPGLSGVQAIAAGNDYSLALMGDGTVMAWGTNTSGQLGDGTNTTRLSPVVIPGLSGVVAIAAGNLHAMAILSNGSVMAWGQNVSGRLGDGTTTNQSSPVSVSNLALGVIPLDTGGQCNASSDCLSGNCTNGFCQAPTCTDGIKNGTETDVDCGGGTCSTCNNGAQCDVASDCLSGNCTNGVCQPSYTLTVDKSGTGSGTVQSAPVGISCGPDCTEPFTPNAIVTLTQQAEPGSLFTGWAGVCTGAGTCQVTMNTDVTVGVTFAADTDSDGIADEWEISSFGDLTTANSTTDFDNDGILDVTEFTNHTDPKVNFRTIGSMALYPFDGNANDTSGNGNNGTPTAGLSYAPRLSGQAMVFPANLNQEKVLVPDTALLDTDDTFTLSALVHPTEYRTVDYRHQVIAAKWYSSPHHGDFIFEIGSGANAGLLQLEVADNPTNTQNNIVIDALTAPPGTEIPLNQWTLVTATFDHGLMKLYVNNQLVAQKMSTTVTHTDRNEYTYDDLAIGNLPLTLTSSQYNFIGAIDEVRLFDRSLSAEEVLALYHELNPPPAIDSISPSSGPAGSSIPVTIHGTSFGSAAGTVNFGSSPCAVTTWTTTQIVCDSPALPNGTVDVTVFLSPGNSATVTNGFTYQVSYNVNVHSVNGVKAIAGGQSSSLALKDDGTVVSFGSGNTTTALGTGIKAIAEGGLAVGITNAGTVVNLQGSYQYATIPAGLDQVIAVAVGQYGTLAVRADGTVVGWGEPFTSSWVVPEGLGNVKAVANSFDLSLALKNDGAVVQWGYLDDGNSQNPQPPASLHDVKSIAAGYYHAVAVNGDGTVAAWGRNDKGQINVPAGLTDVVAVDANPWGEHTVAVKANGTVIAWGDNTHGQCSVPADLTEVVAVAAGSTYSLALKSNGTIVAWGKTWQNGSYQDVVVPAELNDKEVIGLAKGASATHIAAIKNGGDVAAWGGDIGGGLSGFIGLPSGVDGVISLAVGSQFTVAAKGDGTVVASAMNSYGQATVPEGLGGVTAVATGGHHVVALKSDGTVVAWGDDPWGLGPETELTTVPPGLNSVVEIAAGPNMSLARKSDGTVVGWGNSNPALYSVPTFSGTKAVAVGEYYAAVIKSDKTVYTWGGMQTGTQPAGLTNVTAIAAGPYHIAALKSDGTVVVWGADVIMGFDPSLAAPAGLTDVVAISAGTGYVAALKNDGTVVVWGTNTYGANNVPTSQLTFDLIGHGDVQCVSPVVQSSDSTCTITPDSGFHLATFAVNGVDQLAGVGNNSYTIANVHADQTVSASFAANTVPSAPRNVTAVAGPGGGEITISFDPPLSDGHSPIYGYMVVVNTPEQGYGANSDASPITVSGLPIGTPQTFIVYAINGVGTSPASEPSNSVTPTPPNFTVTFSAASNGTVSGALSQNVSGGANTTPVSAIPNAGMAFAGWSGDYTGTANPLTVTNVQANMVITANFTPDIDGDGDGVTASADPFPNDPTEWKDTDHEGIGDNSDNCVTVANTNQADADQDAIGDACDSQPNTANYGSVIDAPHNGTHGVTCGDCHSYTLWWQHSPATASTTPSYASITNAVCAKCHGNASHVSDPPGAWAMKCVDCHSAHDQAQVDWRGLVNIDDLYLKRGTIGGGFVVSGGKTTLNYTLAESYVVANPEWNDQTAWGKKNSTLPPSGLILVVDTANATNTYEVLSATGTTITIKGGIDPLKAGKTFGLIYGQMIKKSIATPAEGNREVRFFNPLSPSGGYTDSNTPVSGICQVCHANATMSWNSSGGGSNSVHDAVLGNGPNCTECHTMAQGFKKPN